MNRIDVKDLPPAYQVQVLQKLAERERRKQCQPIPSTAGATPVGERKYHNKPTERVTAAGNVLRFDSQREARRYDELTELERAGIIRDLRMQVDFTLQEAYTDGEGKRVHAIRYRADFTYDEKWVVSPSVTTDFDGKQIELIKEQITWVKVVEDVKSRPTKTKAYIMKRKMMKERLGIDIQEV